MWIIVTTHREYGMVKSDNGWTLLSTSYCSVLNIESLNHFIAEFLLDILLIHIGSCVYNWIISFFPMKEEVSIEVLKTYIQVKFKNPQYGPFLFFTILMKKMIIF